MDLKDAEEASPIELVEYVVTSKIVEESAFAWWVPYTLKKRKLIIAKVKNEVLEIHSSMLSKYGVCLPKNAEETSPIGKLTGTNFWENTLNKEMNKGKIVYVEGCTPNGL